MIQTLKQFPVVVLTGARQTGKSTLSSVSAIASNRTYLTMDDFETMELAKNRPDELLQKGEQLTLDEVQRMPRLLLAIKRSVDLDRRKGRFLLTGSANLLMMRRVADSLAGRAVYLHLWPMTESEKKGSPDPGPWGALLKAADVQEAKKKVSDAPALKNWAERALVGGYPLSVFAADSDERAQWFEGYVRTYLERDLQEVSTIVSLGEFHRLMRLASMRIGQLLNSAELARDCGLAQATAYRYLDLLETSLQIVRLPAFGVNRTKRLIKMPKMYWTDSGLGAYLAGHKTAEDARASRCAGALLENLLLIHLLAWRELETPSPEIMYWRTHTGEEVDFVIESGRRVLPVEVKSSVTVERSDTKSMEVFLSEYPDLAPFGVLLYSGEETRIIGTRILAVPLGAAMGDSTGASSTSTSES